MQFSQLIILAACIISGIIYQKVVPEPKKNWREEIEADIQQLEKQLKSAPDEEKSWIQDQFKQNQQYLDKNVNPNAKSNWHYMNSVVTGINSLVTLFAVIVCSANVSAEFSDGTIKQLLIRPHKRWAILLAKYFAVIIYSLLLVLTLIVSGYLVGLILFGSGDFHAKIIEPSIAGQKEVIVGTQFFLKMLYYLPGLFIIMTISFMLSTLFKNQALAVGIGIFVLFFSTTLGGYNVVLAEKYEWVKFLIFPHLDLTIYALQDKILQDITLPESLGILTVYYVVFIIITFVFFEKEISAYRKRA